MTTTSKRLDKVEQNLSAKELAIRFANEITNYNSAEEFFNAVNESPHSMEKFLGPWDLIDKQVEAKIRGKGNDNDRAKCRSYESMSIEFKTLQNIIFNINTEINQRLEKASLEGALHIQYLKIIILQDSFNKTARDTAYWIENSQNKSKDGEGAKQIILKNLQIYYSDINGKANDVIGQLNGNNVDNLFDPTYLSQIEDWVFRVKSLIFDLYSHKVAIQFIQDEYLNGNSFLFLNAEKQMQDTIGLIQDMINKHNRYLEIRVNLLNTQGENAGRNLPGNSLNAERFNHLKIDNQTLIPPPNQVEDLAMKWITNAKMEAVLILKEKYGASWMELQQIVGGN